MSTLAFQPEVLLLIAEHADLNTVSCLSQTCRSTHQLLRHFEASICKAKLQQHPIPPTTPILSSDSAAREILHPHTLMAVAELRRRERRIDTLLLHGDFFSTGDAAVQPAGLREGLGRALCLCDRIADIDAEVAALDRMWVRDSDDPAGFAPGLGQGRGRWVVGDRHNVAAKRLAGLATTTTTTTTNSSSLVADSSSEEGDDADRMSPPALSHGAGPAENSAQLPRMARLARVRLAQVALVWSLAARDLAWLYYLAQRAGAGYVRGQGGAALSDPDIWERRTVFEEMVLRHGSALLSGFARCCGSDGDGSSEEAHQTRETLRLGFEEHMLFRFERETLERPWGLGDDEGWDAWEDEELRQQSEPRGLLMNLFRAFGEKTGCAEPVKVAMTNMVERELGLSKEV